MASMTGEGKCSKSGLWISGADSTKPLSGRRTRKSRHPMSGCSAGKCNSRSSMDVRMPNASVPPVPSGGRGVRCQADRILDRSGHRAGYFIGHAERGLAVAAAEQEDEPLQVITQVGRAVGGVADELCQGGAQAVGVAGQPLAEELQHLGQLASVGGVELDIGHGDHCPFWVSRAWVRLSLALAL